MTSVLLKPAPVEPALEQVRELQNAIQTLGTWAIRHIVGEDIYPARLPPELDAVLDDMCRLCDQLRHTLSQIREDDTRLMLGVMRKLRAGTQLSEEEFYLCRAIGDLNPPSDTRTEYAVYLQTFN